MSLTNELSCRAALYARQKTTTELGEETFDYVLQGFVWAKIMPLGRAGALTGGVRDDLPGEVTASAMRHSIVLRANALPHPAEDMYLVYKGVRYNVDFWRPHYRRPDRIELICTMEVKTA